MILWWSIYIIYRSLDPCYKVSRYIKWVQTFWTYSTSCNGSKLFIHIQSGSIDPIYSVSFYIMTKKSRPNLYSNLVYKIDHYCLDIQYLISGNGCTKDLTLARKHNPALLLPIPKNILEIRGFTTGLCDRQLSAGFTLIVLG